LTTSDRIRPLCTLAFATEGQSYDTNLAVLLQLIAQTPDDAVVLAPEVCLTGFDYAQMDAAAAFAEVADAALRGIAGERIVILTMIVSRQGEMYNAARVYHGGEMLYEQHKAKLFALGAEHKWFAAGSEEAIAIFEAGGIRMGILICFELRFPALWERLRGAELIAVPAQWGKLRTPHYDLLGRALAVANECYVMQSDVRNEDTSGIGGIVTPPGETARNGDAVICTRPFRVSEVKKMRRYLDTGIR